MICIDAAKHGARRRQCSIHIDKQGLVVRKLDSFTDQAQELSDGQVSGNQILVLVDVGQGGGGRAAGRRDLGGTLDDDGDLVGVGFGDLLELLETVLEGVGLFKGSGSAGAARHG